MAKVAFYAPIKPPDHPIPSGDREIARALVAALGKAGYEVEIATRFIAYIKRSSRQTFLTLQQDAMQEAETIMNRWQGKDGSPPDLWFTYHPYCKAPDFFGPFLSDRLQIPYVTAEACRTGQGTPEDWAEARAVTQDAIRRADANFCLKPSDETYLLKVLGHDKTIVRLAPFLEIPPRASTVARADNDPVRLITVAMMRPGAKLKSYEMLAAGLSGMSARNWTLTIVGDGPERQQVEQLFQQFGSGRVRFTGELEHDAVPEHLASADIYVWPGVREAIGMAYLEAQAQALPVVAQKTLGIPWVVADGKSGLLTPENDLPAFTAAIECLVTDQSLRQKMGAAARRNVDLHHSAGAAARTLKTEIDRLLGELG